MDLRFGGPRANRTPGHQISDVLRGDHVEELDAGREPERIDFQQHFTPESQSPVNVKTAIQRGVVDQTLPADRGTGLFKIDPHDDFKLASKSAALLRQASRVLVGCLRVVN